MNTCDAVSAPRWIKRRLHGCKIFFWSPQNLFICDSTIFYLNTKVTKNFRIRNSFISKNSSPCSALNFSKKTSRKLWRVLNVKAFLQFSAKRLKTQDDNFSSLLILFLHFIHRRNFLSRLILAREGNFQTKVRHSWSIFFGVSMNCFKLSAPSSACEMFYLRNQGKCSRMTHL